MVKKINFLVTLMLVMLCSTAWAQTTVTFDASKDKSSDNVILKKDGVTIAIGGGVLNNGTEYRFYKNKEVRITSTVGNITRVEFTCTASGTSKYGPGGFGSPTSGNYTYSDKVGTWTGDTQSFALTAATNQVRAKQIVVTYTSSVKTATTLTFAEGDKTFDVGGGQRHGKLYQCSHSFTCSGGCFHRL